MYDYSFHFNNEIFSSLVNDINIHIASLSEAQKSSALNDIFCCIDNTSLGNSDTEESIANFCDSTLLTSHNNNHVASVCVYPAFVATAKSKLASSNIKVASVAGAFPSGQLPLELKLREVEYALSHGADEIDFVVNRGNIISGKYDLLYKEIANAKEVCGQHVLLKVILETGELPSPQAIYAASRVALDAGADFIKTSTGKISVGATPESVYIMLVALSDFAPKTQRNVGFKAAGGISTISDAMLYYFMTKKILKKEIINCQNFRLGTSRLTAQVHKLLTN